MIRIIYALIMAYRYYAKLSALVKDNTRVLITLTQIDSDYLRKKNVEVLALDFDGVLAPHGESIPEPEVHAWLLKISQDFGQERLVVLTNKPNPVRIAWFEQHYPKILFVKGARKKPYPDGLEKILELKHIPPHALALADDRLLTGMLATCIAKTQGFYVTKPYQNVRKRPVQECFFSLLRCLERRWLL